MDSKNCHKLIWFRGGSQGGPGPTVPPLSSWRGGQPPPKEIHES